MSDEEYIAIDCWIVRRTDDAVLIRVGSWNAGKQAWIPRCTLYGPDEKDMARATAGTRMNLRMFRWQARQNGILPQTDDTTAADQKHLFEDGQ